MSLSRDESRALGFVAVLLVLSAGARLLDRPEPIGLDAASVDLNALEAASSEAKSGRNQKVRPFRTGERIDPNTAPVSELMRLPRSTRAMAERIVAERNARPFRSLAELDRVKGIGPATLQGWAPYVTLPEKGPAEVEPPRTEAATRGAEPATQAREPVDLNRATAAELERVPGIGPALAARIVARRDSLGGFRSLAELERIRGIGPATLKKLIPHLKL
jgi:competence ComEA-like helix-hairpin-helix protein